MENEYPCKDCLVLASCTITSLQACKQLSDLFWSVTLMERQAHYVECFNSNRCIYCSNKLKDEIIDSHKICSICNRLTYQMKDIL